MAPQNENDAYQLRGGRASFARPAAKAISGANDKKLQLEELNRLLVEPAENAAVRAGSGQLLTEQEPLQVLFVLRSTNLPGPPSSAPPATSESGESP